MARKHINIEALEVIDAIERRGSFASAAEELGKATSALSYIIQKLEEQLDVTLFTREGRRSVLTAAGRVVLQDGRDILTASEKLADRAIEVATGWEPRLNISIGAPSSYRVFFEAANLFLAEHPSIELDVSEHILNGGWEMLERDKVDLLVSIPGPVPANRGYRSILLGKNDLALVAAKHHPILKFQNDEERLEKEISQCRRVIAHDTTQSSIATSAGLISDSDAFYVQTMDQKVEAQLAGIGIGHLPRAKIQPFLDSGELVELKAASRISNDKVYLVWKVANKGKALAAMVKTLESALIKTRAEPRTEPSADTRDKT